MPHPRSGQAKQPLVSQQRQPTSTEWQLRRRCLHRGKRRVAPSSPDQRDLGFPPKKKAEPDQGRTRSPRNTAFKKVAAPMGVAGVDSERSRTFVRTAAPRQNLQPPRQSAQELNIAAALRDDCIASTTRRIWRGRSGHPPPATRRIPEAHLTSKHPAVQRTRVVAARCRG